MRRVSVSELFNTATQLFISFHKPVFRLTCSPFHRFLYHLQLSVTPLSYLRQCLPSQPATMDEVIFFRRPPEASHLVLFNLPKPPHHLELAELYEICDQYGPLYDCTIRYTTAPVAASSTEDDATFTQPPQPNADTQQPQATQQPPDLATTQQPSSSTQPTQQAHSTSVLPHQLSSDTQVVNAYAHVHYYSLHDARTAKKHLHNRLLHSTRIRATFSSRPPPPSQYSQLAMHACVALMNRMVGWGRWSCSVGWLQGYDGERHGGIVGGQVVGSAAQWELDAFEAMRGAKWPCSFACEVELVVPGQVSVACQAVSHSMGKEVLRDRENGRKRAVTNA